MSSGAARSPESSANLNCLHCGICLSVCPTYAQLGSEPDSPRGRIYLINALAEGRIEATSQVFEKHISLCLECRACETACPSGVRYSVMMNGARETIRSQRQPGYWESVLNELVFELVFPHPAVMHVCFRLLRFYQRSGLQKLMRATGLLRLFPKRLGQMEAMLPEVPEYPGYRLPTTAPIAGKLRVALFHGCIMPELFGPVHEATVRVLERNGAQVCLPARQTCCGALHLHEGEVAGARALARRNIDAFEHDGAETVVVNAAGCGAMLKEYRDLLRDDLGYAERAAAFSARVKDISEFLDGIGIDRNMRPLPIRVTYDDPCHLLHAQGIKTAPRNLLRSIPGLELIEAKDSDRCCGSAGVYNVMQPEMADRILEDKIANLEQTGAQAVASGNPGCLLQIQNGIRRHSLRMEVVHPIELLDRAYRKQGPTTGGQGRGA
jgi:glycolate oxidase iron-sulfur subunit